jgi:hypothetical protein
MTSPQPMPTPNLAGLLTKPAALKALAKKETTVGPPPSTDLVTAEGDTRVAPIAEPPSQEAGAAAKADHDAADEAAIHGRRQYLRSITIYLPRSIHQKVAVQAAARETTHTALILTAINATHPQIGSALTDHSATAGKRDLFDIPQERAITEPSVQTTIRVTDSQLRAIEILVSKHETNRSHLISTALQLYLR